MSIVDKVAERHRQPKFYQVSLVSLRASCTIPWPIIYPSSVISHRDFMRV
jgi:hypothetical protein